MPFLTNVKRQRSATNVYFIIFTVPGEIKGNQLIGAIVKYNCNKIVTRFLFLKTLAFIMLILSNEDFFIKVFEGTPKKSHSLVEESF